MRVKVYCDSSFQPWPYLDCGPGNSLLQGWRKRSGPTRLARRLGEPVRRLILDGVKTGEEDVCIPHGQLSPSQESPYLIFCENVANLWVDLLLMKNSESKSPTQTEKTVRLARG